MKQQDVAILIIVIFFAGIFSFLISSKFITPSNKKLTAETVQAIHAEFPMPEKGVFNEQAVNPTVRIQIAPGTNPQPFTNQAQ